MKTDKLVELAQRYYQRGVQKGYELLLSPVDALSLNHQLAERNVLVLGCDCWRYVDREQGWIVQVWEIELSVEAYLPPSEITVEASSKMIERFLMERVPPSIDLISLHIADPDIAALFVTQPKIR